MKFAFYTLGCKVNQYETQAMEQLLQSLGHEIGSLSEPCDGYVVNTCSVTAVSDKKCRGVIRRLRRQAPDAVIGVCGCYAQVAPEVIRTLGADVISGTSDRSGFVQMLLIAAAEKTHLESVDDALHRRDPFEPLPAGSLETRTRAM
ncbi:MAG: tRNA (N(6)-L-threonylcarbamoyladenosine(37)-C(2))-methylthiotransferase MtaB, partial [Oscillospiraceae bacterium]|nr:tRNA (N(6)-L-threonylcarbamoyladenosine(37)-C(2))-methylthiotransferase MtaB [Oscillospiraceae bacterium]